MIFLRWLYALLVDDRAVLGVVLYAAGALILSLAGVGWTTAALAGHLCGFIGALAVLYAPLFDRPRSMPGVRVHAYVGYFDATAIQAGSALAGLLHAAIAAAVV